VLFESDVGIGIPETVIRVLAKSSIHSVILLALLSFLPKAVVLTWAVSPDASQQSVMTVAGEVRSITCRIEGGLISSYVSVFVMEVRNGSSSLKSAEIIVKHIGGEVGRTVLWRSDQPYFFVGEFVELVIEPEDQVFKVVGGHIGKVRLDQNLQPITQRTAAGYRLIWFRPPSEWQDSTTRPGSDWYGPLRWSSSGLQYWINTQAIPPDLSASSFITYATASFQTWEDDPGSSFDFTYRGTRTDAAPGMDDGINLVGWRSIGGGTIAQTWLWASYTPGSYDSLRISETDVEFDNSKLWSAQPSGVAGRFDVQNIGTHEAGHTFALGDLYDTEDSEQTMYGYGATGETKKRTLAWGDEAGIRTLYPFPYTVTFTTSTTTTNSTTLTIYGSTTTVTSQRSTTTTTDTTVVPTSYQTTVTSQFSGSISTTYTVTATSYSTQISYYVTTSTSNRTSTSFVTELSRTGTSTTTWTSTAYVVSGYLAYENIIIQVTFVEQFLKRITSIILKWFSEAVQITQTFFVTPTVKDTVVRVEPLDLNRWPSLFAGRAVLQVIGSGTSHGPYNDYAKVGDTVALVDVVGAPGYAPGAGTLTRFDTEVITETGPPWAWSWKTGYTTQDVIAVGGPVVSGVNRMYNSLSKAPCTWDDSTWEIVCKDGSRYSDPSGRHGYIAVFTDGGRVILVVSGYSAFVTRGLGVILRNPTMYSSILKGQAAIVKLTDSNGNGVFELGETVELIHTV